MTPYALFVKRTQEKGKAIRPENMVRSEKVDQRSNLTEETKQMPEDGRVG